MATKTIPSGPGRGRSLSVEGLRLEGPALIERCRALAEAPSTPAWEAAFHRFVLDWFGPSETILQRSSGTTGRPKDLLLPKRAMEASARNTLEFFGLGPGSSALLCLPLDYIAGKMMVVRALVGGLDLRLAEPSGRPPLPERDIDFCAMVPLQVSNCLCSPAFRRIRTLIIGGAEISPELGAALAREPTAAWATYGMAETCSQVALRRVNGPEPEEDYGSMQGVSLSLDERGCLRIEADYLPEPVQTNDLCRLGEGGRFRWLGRFDNLINSGGLKIAPEELEAKIAERLGRACALVGLPDPLLGRRLVAVFEGEEEPPSAAELAEALGPETPRRALPKALLRLPELPRNASFKLDRRALAALLAGGEDRA